MRGAFSQAQVMDHGWVGPEHVLLSLLSTPNTASDVLAGLGITYERLQDHLRSLRYDPDLPPLRYSTTGEVKTNPAFHELRGWATGYAAACGLTGPTHEHWLLGLLYASDRGDMWVHAFNVRAQVVVDALAAHGVRVPDFAPPEYHPWQAGRTVYVEEAEVQPIIDLLNERDAKGSKGRWGFNYVGEPRRGVITAEEGIDLDAIVAEARARMKS
jgi:hypothetical protein